MRATLPISLCAALAAAAALAGVAQAAAIAPRAPASGATISGRVTGSGDGPLPGMRVEAVPAGTSDCTSDTGCAATYSAANATYTLSGLATGEYSLDVVDGSTTVTVTKLTVRPSTRTLTRPLELGPAAVPAGTVSRSAGAELRWLNAERARDGVGAGVVLNPRWSRECAAHDDYEAANDMLTAVEDPTASGASAGGAWAGQNSVLAQGRWTPSASPWEDAPVHLLALLAPSLAVTGLDDSGTFQCAITFPGMVRTAGLHDRVTTVPAPGAVGVIGSELAREAPFTPVQFAGLPADLPTGRELFVYLNQAGEIGQAAVRIVGATLNVAGHAVAVRTVDSTTPTLGPYLAGGIIIPVRPLRAMTTYRASVTLSDGDRTLTQAWSFTTGQPS